MTDTDEQPNSSESIMADLWSVPDGNQQAVLDGLTELFERMRDCPGFVEAQILRSVNPTKILAYTRFDSPANQQRAQDAVATGTMVQRLRAIAHQDLSRYTLARSFLPAD
jgi:Antibiotic biosynthesis monooxygenase